MLIPGASMSRGSPQQAISASQPSGAPSLGELRNMTYHLDGLEEPVTLTNGVWEGAPYVPGGASRPIVRLVGDFRLSGAVVDENAEDSIVVLASRSGGTGDRIHVAVVRREGDAPRNIATALVGDRVQIRGARLENRRISLDVIQAGQDDAMCCPGELATRSWELDGGILNELPRLTTGRLSPDVMGGREWVLRSWSSTESAPLEPRVTMRFQDGQLSGHAGCNSYVTRVDGGDLPGTLSVGPIRVTRRVCSRREMTVEQRFIRQLERVTQYTFVVGQLALSYARERRTEAMRFDR